LKIYRKKSALPIFLFFSLLQNKVDGSSKLRTGDLESYGRSAVNDKIDDLPDNEDIDCIISSRKFSKLIDTWI
jgi:hypothetical protein